MLAHHWKAVCGKYQIGLYLSPENLSCLVAKGIFSDSNGVSYEPHTAKAAVRFYQWKCACITFYVINLGSQIIGCPMQGLNVWRCIIKWLLSMPSNKQIADIFMNDIPIKIFPSFRRQLGMTKKKKKKGQH